MVRPPLLRPLCDRSGNVTIEAAIITPFLILMFVLTADVVRYLETLARMERVAAVTADLVARSETVIDWTDFAQPTANNDLATFFSAANEVAFPDDLESHGRIYVSVVEPGNGGGFTTLWQRTGPYLLTADSRLTTLPALPAHGNYVVAEVIFDFEPMLLSAPGLRDLIPSTIYRRAIFRPRLTALATLTPRDGS